MKRTTHKQAGITLVELLVAMLCATLVISMVVSTLLFITFSTDELIQKGSEGYQAQSMKEYILSQNYSFNPEAEYTVNTEENTLSHNGTVIVGDTELLNVEFSDDENFIYCILVFPNESYRFVAGTKKGGSI